MLLVKYRWPVNERKVISSTGLANGESLGGGGCHSYVLSDK